MNPDPQRLRETVATLSELPTRNSLSPHHREAADRIAARLASAGVPTEIWPYTLPSGRRVPVPTEAVSVLGTLPGRTDRRIVLSAHFDSFVLEGAPLAARAPGANDDASGVAAVLECARLLAGSTPRNTLVFALLSGEEQGLLGAKALAQRAVEEGWTIDAVLNLDTVGSSGNLRGQSDAGQVRVFSEEGPSRELARFVALHVEEAGFGAKLVLRKDRVLRGGDHTPFQLAGFPAVRFTECHEEYSRQHTEDDVIEAMDFDYLAGVTRLVLAAARSLAAAGTPPERVFAERLDGHDTRLTWEGESSATVYWRETTSPTWQGYAVAEGNEHLLRGVRIDEHEFAAGTGGVPLPAAFAEYGR